MADSRWIVAAAEAGLRLDKFLAAPDRIGSRRRAYAALERGKIFIGDQEVDRAAAARRLAAGEVVRLWMDRPGSSRAQNRRLPVDDRRDSTPLRIVHEDAAMVVLNKPPGLLAVPLARRRDAASVYDALIVHLRRHRERPPLVVHRIDRDTSGLVVFAKTVAAQEHLKDQFRRHEAERVYRAVVYGHPLPASGRWCDHLAWDDAALVQKATDARDPRGVEAVSDYRVLERFAAAALLEVRLVTGKRNQIRIQAALHGCPLVGERRYLGDPAAPRLAFPRQALHAFRLTFRHPATDRLVSFEAPLPDDLTALITRLRESP